MGHFNNIVKNGSDYFLQLQSIQKNSLTYARVRKVFSFPKMPLCHLPCVYRGSRGGIMVALVAFSGDYSENIMLKSGFFATWLIQADSPKGVFRLKEPLNFCLLV